MGLDLDARALRIVGSLIEKELATPDYYPLSLPALQAACNQKTSRDPVSSYTAEELEMTLGELIGRGLVRERRPAGSRVAKYAHRLGDSLGLSFGFNRGQLAVLAVLLLRGDQTANEIRARTERMRDPQDDRPIEHLLGSLVEHEKGPWVREMAREPGRRETRWGHLLADNDEASMSGESGADDAAGAGFAPTSHSREDLPADADSHTQVLDDSVPATTLPRAMEELQRRVAQLEARLRVLERPGEDRD